VLIHAGAGGVGLAAIQLAKAAGAEILTTASSDEKLARLKDIGATHTINYRSGSFVEQVERAVGKNGVDLVVDPVGGKTLQDSVSVLTYKGRIVNLGFAGRDMNGFQTRPLWMKNAALIGLSLWSALEYEPQRVSAMIGECLARVAKGELKVVIDRRFPLSQARDAHAYIESRAAFGRVLLLPKG
jgi:NADPH2:quinone reductase